MKHYSPTGRRNHGRPLKRLLDTWDRKVAHLHDRYMMMMTMMMNGLYASAFFVTAAQRELFTNWKTSYDYVFKIIVQFSETASLLCPDHLRFKGSCTTEEGLMSLPPQYVCSKFKSAEILMLRHENQEKLRCWCVRRWCFATTALQFVLLNIPDYDRENDCVF